MRSIIPQINGAVLCKSEANRCETNLPPVCTSVCAGEKQTSQPLAFALFQECLNGGNVFAIVLIATAGPFLVDELNREFLVLIHTIIFTQKSIMNYLHFNSLCNAKGIKLQTA